MLSFVPISEIKKIRKKISDPFLLSKILAEIFRINTLYMITYAGSGHIGTSFSCMDIITWLWTEVLINPNEKDKDQGDILFSSKGHDVPAFYSLLIGLEKLDFDFIHKLRRINGLPGHPDIGTPHIATNTGSLGMGISKARGMAEANRLKGKGGHFYVLTGDGELQEGQIWESLQPTANGKFSEITVIVDHNKFQSDIKIEDTSSLGNLEDKFKAFGWEVGRCNGHDFKEISEALAYFKTIKDRPQILIADTLKGKGVSFMEKAGEDGLYKFHSVAPTFAQYDEALKELLERVNALLASADMEPLKLETKEPLERTAPPMPQRLVSAHGDELVKLAREHKEIVGMDADLVLDTGLLPFKKEFPMRYIECGIAEQDMVSVAGGLALRGMLPVVHSFACFLSTRANEHFYNNATEKTKIIYVGALAGLLPGMPGHSHQSVRDIAALGAIPGLILLEPCNEKEARMAIRWAVEKNLESTYIRLVNVPTETGYDLPSDYNLEEGRGVFLASGRNVAIVSYGPTMLTEAYKASKLLLDKGISAAVINLPWLNKLDEKWCKGILMPFRAVVTIDDHYTNMGQGSMLAATLARISDKHPKIVSLGVNEIPACGQNDEVLKYHKLDTLSLTNTIEGIL